MNGNTPFTEIDVINNAARLSWTQDDYKKAMTQANQIAYAYYRSGKLQRYGPVHFQGEEDYLRYASKIVYAGPTGPNTITTPNGTFPAIMAHEDHISSVGRRAGTNRDDLHEWPKDEEYQQLQEQIKHLSDRIEDLEDRAGPRRVFRRKTPAPA